MSQLREQAVDIFQAGVRAADPQQAVEDYLSFNNGQLQFRLNNGSMRQGVWSKVHLIAFGKAACAMIQAAKNIIPDTVLSDTQIAVTNYENYCEIEGVSVYAASHPLPDAAGLAAAEQIADAVTHLREGELLLTLISGGGSALLPLPVAQVTLQEKIAVTDSLLACGADITEINCVRKHLSRLKGGRLAELALPADVHALILSDVLGDDVSAIASGPVAADDSTYQQAVAVLKNRGIWDDIPESVRKVLQKGCDGLIQETPDNKNSCFNNTGYSIIGSNAISLQSIIEAAESKGFTTQVFDSTLSGIAREQAENLALFSQQSMGNKQSAPLAILSAGETTVNLQGNGQGGRNQEMALAFAIATEKIPLPENWVFLSGGTDGRDGPTDAAGGIVDQGTVQRIAAQGADALAYLNNNDSYMALQQSGDLLITGATGTNVADLQILLIDTNS